MTRPGRFRTGPVPSHWRGAGPAGSYGPAGQNLTAPDSMLLQRFKDDIFDISNLILAVPLVSASGVPPRPFA